MKTSRVASGCCAPRGRAASGLRLPGNAAPSSATSLAAHLAPALTLTLHPGSRAGPRIKTEDGKPENCGGTPDERENCGVTPDERENCGGTPDERENCGGTPDQQENCGGTPD